MQNHPKIPKYWKLAEGLREQIEGGTLLPGARLPSVAEMQAQHGVSLSTVNQAHALLEKDGLIVREQGRGTFVAQPNIRNATRTLGLLLRVGPRLGDYMMDLLTGVRREALLQNLNLLWLNEEEAPDPAGMDALLMVCHPSEALAFNLPPELPQILLFHHSSDFTCVCADDFAGAKLAAQHMFDLGHRRIAYLLATDHDSISRRRLAGYQAALEEAGSPGDENLVQFLREPRRLGYRKSAELTMQSWLQTGWRELGCTAILAHNDEVAIGVLKALHEHGLRVPQDVSVVGFDGTELCELSTPTLTTVKVPLREIGVAAVKVLATQIRKGVSLEPQKIVLPVQLQLGASTAPAKSRSEAFVSLPN